MFPMIEKAIPLLEESYQYWRNQGNQRQLGLALNDLSWGYLWKGCWNKSETYALEAKLIFEQLSDEARLVASLNNLGCVQMFRAIPNEAIPYFEKNLELTKRLKDQRRYVYSLISIGESNYIKGLYELAESQIQEAIVVCRNNSYLFEAYGLATLGFIYYAKGDFEACTKISWETEKLGRAAYINFAVLGALVHRVLAAFGKGDLENAKLWSDKAKPFADKLVSTRWAVRHNNIRAKIAMRLGEIELAKK